MADRIKVVIAGINGRMGKASAGLILADPELELVGAFGRPGADYAGLDVGSLTQKTPAGILVSNRIEELPAGIQPDVLLDFSLADAAVAHATFALDHGFRPVIGASGVPQAKIDMLSQVSSQKRLGAFVAPNFS